MMCLGRKSALNLSAMRSPSSAMMTLLRSPKPANGRWHYGCLTRWSVCGNSRVIPNMRLSGRADKPVPGPVSSLSSPSKLWPPKDQNSMDPKLRQQIAARVAYYRELGIYDFYRREGSAQNEVAQSIEAASAGNIDSKVSKE